jgi:hypothetical protein
VFEFDTLTLYSFLQEALVCRGRRLRPHQVPSPLHDNAKLLDMPVRLSQFVIRTRSHGSDVLHSAAEPVPIK